MISDKRALSDRRGFATKSFSRYTLRGRRTRARRVEECHNYYVDQYHFRYLFLIASILILCFLDAYLTLLLLQIGGIELNPFMLYFIKKDVVLSMVVKYAMTASALIFILIHKNFKVFGGFKVSKLISMIFAVYVVLVLFEAFSCFRIMGFGILLSIF